MNACDVYCVLQNVKKYLDGHWFNITNTHTIIRQKRDVEFWNKKAYKTRIGILCDKISKHVLKIEDLYHIFAYAWWSDLHPYKDFDKHYIENKNKFHTFQSLEKDILLEWRLLCIKAFEENANPKEIIGTTKDNTMSILVETHLKKNYSPHILFLFNKIFNIDKKTESYDWTVEESKIWNKHRIIFDKWHILFYNEYNNLDYKKMKINLRSVFNEIF